MIITVDQEDILTLSTTQENVIKNDIHSDRFSADMNRRVVYSATRLYIVMFRNLKRKWDEKLIGRVEFFPESDEDYATLVFAQPDYVSFWENYQQDNSEENLDTILPSYDNSQTSSVKVDAAEVATITPIQKQVMEAEMWPHTINQKIKDMITNCISEKYLQCYKRLKQRWDPVLRSRGIRIPTDRDQYAQLVFSQPDYQSRSQRNQP